MDPSLGSPSLKPDGSARRISRVIEPASTSFMVRTERTLASIVLGQGSKAEHWLFTMGVQNSTSTSALWALWFIGAFTGLLVLYGTIPSKFVWLSTMMLPLPVLTFFVLSKDLVMELLGGWDFYTISLWQLVMVSHAAIEIQDKRCFFWVFSLPTFLVAPLTDAYPGKYRPLFVKLYFIGLTMIFVTWIAFTIWQGALSLEQDKLHRDLKLITHSLTTAIFYIRPIHTIMVYPDRLVLISSAMHTTKEVLSESVEDDHGQSMLRRQSTSALAGKVRLARGSSFGGGYGTHEPSSP